VTVTSNGNGAALAVNGTAKRSAQKLIEVSLQPCHADGQFNA
jgi:hypothetical protein